MQEKIIETVLVLSVIWERALQDTPHLKEFSCR